MFGTIRKHSTWLWVIIIIVIIISFVVFFTPNVGSGGGRPTATIDINGQIFNQEDLNNAAREIQLFFMMRNQQPPTRDVLNQAALQRLLVKRLIAQYGITVGNESVADWIKQRLMGGTGSIAGMTYDQYIQTAIEGNGFTRVQFEDFVRTEVGSEILRETIGSSGVLITPEEIRFAYINDNKKTPVEVAYVANSNYVDRVELNPDELTKFYSNRVAAYRSPERINVSYVRLATSNYVAEAEESLNEDGSLDVKVDAEYLVRSNSFAGVEMDELKRQIRQELVDEEALDIAQRKAYEFVNQYYDLEPKNTATMDAAAREIGLSAQKAPPFGRNETPEGLAVGFEFVQAAWALSEEEPFSIPVLAPDGYYAISYEGKIPGAVQPFAEVKEKVEKEYRAAEARKLAQSAADAFYAAATNAVTAGQSFTNLARLSGFQTASLPELSKRSAMEAEPLDLPVSISQIQRLAETQEESSVSRPQFAADGLMILNVGERRDPGEEEIAEGLEEYAELIRNARAVDAYTEWLMRQEAISGIETAFRSAP
jgi:hypothetical protein